jgi:hypothetical protein
MSVGWGSATTASARLRPRVDVAATSAISGACVKTHRPWLVEEQIPTAIQLGVGTTRHADLRHHINRRAYRIVFTVAKLVLTRSLMLPLPPMRDAAVASSEENHPTKYRSDDLFTQPLCLASISWMEGGSLRAMA